MIPGKWRYLVLPAEEEQADASQCHTRKKIWRAGGRWRQRAMKTCSTHLQCPRKSWSLAVGFLPALALMRMPAWFRWLDFDVTSNSACCMNSPEPAGQGNVVKAVNHQDGLGWNNGDSKLKCLRASSIELFFYEKCQLSLNNCLS